MFQSKLTFLGENMGKEYIMASELPQKLRCPKCGSTHVKIEGARKIEFEREEIDGEKIDEEQIDVEWEVIYGVECLECENYADPEDIYKWDENYKED